jgi:hypothetical protein
MKAESDLIIKAVHNIFHDLLKNTKSESKKDDTENLNELKDQLIT